MSALDELVAHRLADVRRRIAEAGGAHVEVLAVTKTFGLDAALAAHRAGCRAVGENYAQEVVSKYGSVQRPFAIHFIGRIQTNKVRLIAPLVDVYESVDRDSVVAELARRVPGARVLVQVATDADEAKGGCALDAAPALVERARDAGLDVLGLMTVGPTVGGPEAARWGFREVRGLAMALRLAVCSMGMSHDLEVAVEEGSTEVRVGSALFGPRPSRA